LFEAHIHGAANNLTVVRCAFSDKVLQLSRVIKFHVFDLCEALACMCVTNRFPFGCSLLLPVDAVNSGATLKVVSDGSWEAYDATAFFNPTATSGGAYTAPRENMIGSLWPGDWSAPTLGIGLGLGLEPITLSNTTASSSPSAPSAPPHTAAAAAWKHAVDASTALDKSHTSAKVTFPLALELDVAPTTTIFVGEYQNTSTWFYDFGTVRVFARNVHSGMPLVPTPARFNCSLEANRHVANVIRLGCSFCSG
jgi:hypothetical protein